MGENDGGHGDKSQTTGKDETVGGNVCVLTKHIPTGHHARSVSVHASFQSVCRDAGSG
jgi:hypothetical protein